MTAHQAFGHQFYPTPQNLARKMLKGIFFRSGQSILEPSAGKGDLINAMINKTTEELSSGHHYKNSACPSDIDTIEIDPNLRQILKGKKVRVVHDDFLTFDTFKRYDLIVMNPPFDRGSEHLEKALSLLKPGGRCICLLNWETIAHPRGNCQNALVSKLNEWGANITQISGAFRDAERKTGVEIALIRVTKPEEKNRVSFIFENMKRAEEVEQKESSRTALIDNHPIRAAIAQCRIEQRSGLRLLELHDEMKPYIAKDLPHPGTDPEKFQSPPLIQIDIQPNEYICGVRKKYWKTLFLDPRFTCQLTSGLEQELIDSVDNMQHYDFSEINILEIRAEMSRKVVDGVKNTIVKLFDELSRKYHWNDDSSKNVHYFNGWKTNKSWYINKKVILQLDGLSSWSGISWDAQKKLLDIEKSLAFLDGGIEKAGDTNAIIEAASKAKQYKDIQLRYITVDFFKKGTTHIKFKDETLLQRLNIFGCQHKNWLPPSYGKTKYDDLAPEEKATVDSFDGETKYREVCNRPDLLVGCEQKLQLLGFAG